MTGSSAALRIRTSHGPKQNSLLKPSLPLWLAKGFWGSCTASRLDEGLESRKQVLILLWNRDLQGMTCVSLPACQAPSLQQWGHRQVTVAVDVCDWTARNWPYTVKGDLLLRKAEMQRPEMKEVSAHTHSGHFVRMRKERNIQGFACVGTCMTFHISQPGTILVPHAEACAMQPVERLPFEEVQNRALWAGRISLQPVRISVSAGSKFLLDCSVPVKTPAA